MGKHNSRSCSWNVRKNDILNNLTGKGILDVYHHLSTQHNILIMQTIRGSWHLLVRLCPLCYFLIYNIQLKLDNLKDVSK